MNEHARTTRRSESKSIDGTTETKTLSEKAKMTTAALDDLLDTIDGVLEENAREFVASYVQHGGQ